MTIDKNGNRSYEYFLKDLAYIMGVPITNGIIPEEVKRAAGGLNVMMSLPASMREAGILECVSRIAKCNPFDSNRFAYSLIDMMNKVDPQSSLVSRSRKAGVTPSLNVSMPVKDMPSSQSQPHTVSNQETKSKVGKGLLFAIALIIGIAIFGLFISQQGYNNRTQKVSGTSTSVSNNAPKSTSSINSNTTDISLNILETKEFNHWSVARVEDNNMPFYMIATGNEYNDVLLIYLFGKTNDLSNIAVFISKTDSYIPVANERRVVQVQIDNQKVNNATAIVTANKGQVQFTIQGINYQEMFETFVAGNKVTFEIDNSNSPILIQFSLLGFTKAFNYVTQQKTNVSSNYETILKDALTWNSITESRKLDSSVAIATLQKDSYINKQWDVAGDFREYYYLLKPISFLGNTIIIVAHDVPGSSPGCCPSLGMTIIFVIDSNTTAINDFAAKSGCSFTVIDYAGLKEMLYDDPQINHKAGTQYGVLSCHESDIP